MRLTEIYLPLREDLARVEAEMARQIASMDCARYLPGGLAEHATRAIAHVFANPGKRLRPALVILSARLLDAPRELWHGCLDAFAAAVELFHTASLVHDDVIDAEETRRDLPALNRLHGNYTAVLVGDLLYAKSFSLLSGLQVEPSGRVLELLRLFCDLTERMCVAEMSEQRILETERDAEPGQYLRILQYKTADLMAACCEGSALLCGAPAALRAALRDFGLSFGMAFQLMDDSRDGDAILRERFDPRAKASEYAAAARALLTDLPGGESRGLMEDLCSYIVQ